jgi:starch synthase
VGGLADTVTNATPEHLDAGTATGIVFDQATPDALYRAIERGLELYRDTAQWQKMQITGMRKDFSWETSAQQYLALYEQAEADRALHG